MFHRILSVISKLLSAKFDVVESVYFYDAFEQSDVLSVCASRINKLR